MSGAFRQAASKARLEGGRRMIWIEIHDTDVPEALIRAGLLCRADEADWLRIGEVLSRVVALWVDEQK
jgi:hypothetical protein